MCVRERERERERERDGISTQHNKKDRGNGSNLPDYHVTHVQFVNVVISA